jgi:hypothetical protein
MPTTRARIVDAHGRRTNSLGFAKVDCHTCTALNRACDRQRPRCGPCLSQRQRCGGFATNLIWKDVALQEFSSVSQRLGSRNLEVAPGDYPNESGRRDRDFRFVRGRMKRTRRPKRRPLEPGDVAGTKELRSSSSASPLHDSPPWVFQPQTPVQNGPDYVLSLEEQDFSACNGVDAISANELGELHGLAPNHRVFMLITTLTQI